MTRREKLDEILAKVPDEKKDEFIVAFRSADSQDERMDVLEKYGIVLTQEDLKQLLSDELDDSELDDVSGGCIGILSAMGNSSISD